MIHKGDHCNKDKCEVLQGSFLIFVYICAHILKDFIYLLLERGEGGKETSMCEKQQSVASHTRPDWGPGHNPGMCPDQE